MSTGVDKILQQMGGSPEKNKTGVDKILEILENGGGGGSGLPPYTSADAGKVLGLGEADPVETEVSIVPLQAKTLDAYGSASLNNVTVTEADFSVGESTATLYVTVGGVTKTAEMEWVDDEGYKAFDGTLDGKYCGMHYNDGWIVMVRAYAEQSVSVEVKTIQSVPSVEPKWETAGGYVAPASSTTVTNTIQSLISDVMTSIITGSKTNMVCKSAILTHSDLASDYAILRETAEKYCSGVHTLFPVATDAYSTVVNGYSESGGTGANLQLVVPNYGIQIPGVGQKLVFLVIAIASSGNAYQVYVSAQIKESIN